MNALRRWLYRGTLSCVMVCDGDENVVSDMVSPLYWFFFYDSGRQIVSDVRHVAQGFLLIQM
jgi:hypothetical protein